MALSMKASCNSHGQDSSYFLGWQEYDKNPYDHIRNPTGIIQMGLAENQLSFDLLESWLAKNHDAAAFKRNGKSLFKELALFQDYHGLPAFKNALAELMAEIRRNKVSFDPGKIVLTAGATSANETLMFCLAEPGDAILVPAPYYPGFDRDLKWRTGAEIVPVQCNSRNGFKLTETNLNEAYETAGKLNRTVKSILITNPSNPLGTTMTRDELKLLIQFITSKRIHLVSDEIYAGTVFGSPKFISILEALDGREHVNNGIRELVHVVHSLSKDLGLPGFRVGAIYSKNEAIISAATKMSSFGLVSSQTQHLLASILSDKAFTRTYISENRKRLKKRHRMLVLGLRDCGISCLESNAGLFCWADMRHLLGSNTFEAEMELWRRIVYDVKLNVSPGTSCHCPEPGWFRVCFANVSEEALDVSIIRLKLFISATYGDIPDDRKSKEHCSRKKWTLRLPFRGREPVER